MTGGRRGVKIDVAPCGAVTGGTLPTNCQPYFTQPFFYNVATLFFPPSWPPPTIRSARPNQRLRLSSQAT
jgi:hypothetical protein